MARTAVEVDPRLIGFVLPSTPESVRMARFHVRAALGFHGLDDYAEDAATITSELVTNAVQHVRGDGNETIGVTLARVWNPPAVTVVVSDSSPDGPRRCDPSAGGERGRGCRSWKRCLRTGAGIRKTAGRQSSRYWPGRHACHDGYLGPADASRH